MWSPSWRPVPAYSQLVELVTTQSRCCGYGTAFSNIPPSKVISGLLSARDVSVLGFFAALFVVMIVRSAPPPAPGEALANWICWYSELAVKNARCLPASRAAVRLVRMAAE